MNWPPKPTSRDLVLLTALVIAAVCSMLLRLHDAGRWGTAVPLLAFLVFGCLLFWPLKRRQWVGIALDAVLIGVYWAGLLPFWALLLTVIVLSLLVPFMAAVYDGYQGT